MPIYLYGENEQDETKLRQLTWWQKVYSNIAFAEDYMAEFWKDISGAVGDFVSGRPLKEIVSSDEYAQIVRNAERKASELRSSGDFIKSATLGLLNLIVVKGAIGGVSGILASGGQLLIGTSQRLSELLFQIENAYHWLRKKTGAISEDEYHRNLALNRIGISELRKAYGDTAEVVNEKQFGVFASLVDTLMHIIGIVPKRVVVYEDADGIQQSVVLPADFVDKFASEIETNGGRLVSVSEGSGAETAYDWSLIMIDLIDPTSTKISGGLFKVLSVGGKGVMSVAAKAGRLMTAPAFSRFQSTAGYKAFTNALVKVEGLIGAPLTKSSQAFNVFSSIHFRRGEAMRTNAERFIMGVEDFMDERGWLYNIYKRNPEQLEQMYGKKFVDRLRDMRDIYIQRKTQYIEAGKTEAEAMELAKADIRHSLSIAQFMRTGLLFTEDVIADLERLSDKPEELMRWLDDIAERHPELPIDAEAVVDGVMRGEVPNWKAALQRDDLDDLKELSKDFVPATYMMNLRRDALDRFDEIWGNTFDDAKAYLNSKGIRVIDSIMDKIDNALVGYSKQTRERLKASLYIIHTTDDPAVKQQLVNILQLHMGTKGMSFNRLVERLGDAPSLVEALQSANKALKFAGKAEAGRILDALRFKTIVAEGSNEEKFMSLIERLKQHPLINKAPIHSIVCAAHYGAPVALTLGAFVKDNVAHLFGAADESDSVVKWLTAEEALRQQVLNHVASAGKTVDDIDDFVIREWLNGESSVFAPQFESPSQAVVAMTQMAEAAGWDRTAIAHAMDLLDTVEDVVRNKIGVEFDNIKVGDMRGFFTEVANRLENFGRDEEAHAVRAIADKAENVLSAVRSFGQLSTEAKKLIDDANSAFGYVYWKIRQSDTPRVVFINELLDMQSRHNSGIEFISETPSSLHTEKIILDNGTSEMIFYTTPYIKRVLTQHSILSDKFVKSELSSLWMSMINLYKRGAVTWNPISFLRDTVSNFAVTAFGMNLSGDEIGKYVATYVKAWKDVINKSEDFFNMAQYTPSAWTYGFDGEELRRIQMWQRSDKIQQLTNLIERAPLMGWIFRMTHKGRMISDVVNRQAMFNWAKNELSKRSSEERVEFLKDMGIDIKIAGTNNIDALAAAISERYLVDYHNVPPLIHFLRKTGIMPFITYESHMIPLLIKDMPKKAKHIFNAMRLYRHINRAGGEEEERNRFIAKEAFISGMDYNPLLLVWGEKGKDGKIQLRYLDLSWWLPYGVLLSPFRVANKLMGGDPSALFREINSRTNGLVSVALQILVNRDFMTGEPIRKAELSTADAMRETLSFVLSNLPYLGLNYNIRGAISNNYIYDRETAKQKLQIKDWRSILGIKGVDLEPAAVMEYEKGLELANRITNEGMKRYNELIDKDPKKAEAVLKEYLDLAERRRLETIRKFDASFILLKSFDANVIDVQQMLDDYQLKWGIKQFDAFGDLFDLLNEREDFRNLSVEDKAVMLMEIADEAYWNIGAMAHGATEIPMQYYREIIKRRQVQNFDLDQRIRPFMDIPELAGIRMPVPQPVVSMVSEGKPQPILVAKSETPSAIQQFINKMMRRESVMQPPTVG